MNFQIIPVYIILSEAVKSDTSCSGKAVVTGSSPVSFFLEDE